MDLRSSAVQQSVSMSKALGEFSKGNMRTEKKHQPDGFASSCCSPNRLDGARELL